MVSSNDLDLVSSEVFADPYPYYKRLREEHPVYWNQSLNAWILTRYCDVERLLLDKRLSSQKDARIQEMLPAQLNLEFQALFHFFSLWMVFSESPLHTRLRCAAANALKQVVDRSLEDYICRCAKDLFARISKKGEMDVLHDIGHLLPLRVITNILGFAPEHIALLDKWSNDIVACLTSGRPIPELCRQAQKSLFSFRELFNITINDRRRTPKRDLITALANEGQKSSTLNEEEIFAISANLVIAGYEPTLNFIANGILSLLTYPSQLDKLRDNVSLLDTTIEELLRYECPFVYSGRIATEDFDIESKRVRIGERVLLMLASANHDPSVFVDPESLDISRDPNPHLAFGLGRHFCFGAALARAEMRAVIKEVMLNLPTMRLVDTFIQWKPYIGLRAVKSLVVQF